MFLMIGQFHLFGKKNKGESWKICVCCLPFIVAMIVAITRTREHYHHFTDIITGAVVGFGCALLVYVFKFCSFIIYSIFR